MIRQFDAHEIVEDVHGCAHHLVQLLHDKLKIDNNENSLVFVKELRESSGNVL